jgi:hypothetical protein
VALGGLLSAMPARAEILYALNTNNQLFRVDSTAPGAASLIGTVTLDGTQTPLSMDFRATDSQLYVLGSGGTIFTINPNTGTLLTTVSTPTFPGTSISGTNYEIDFNPVPNALRIIRSDGQNLRVGGGATLPTGFTDTTYPGTITPVGTAYSNNFAPAASTTLFLLDDQTDSLIEVTNPNNPPAGSLTNRGTLGVALSSIAGFDISQSGIGYAAVGSTLYSVNVTSPGVVNNRATSLGTIGGIGTVKALSVSIAAPEPGSVALLGIGLLGLAGRIRRRTRR